MTTYADACRYVQTDSVSGVAQLALLCAVGLRPEMHILEIGCGALHLARPLLWYLEPERYCGIDPNAWLRESAHHANPALARLCRERGARFSSRDDFDGSGFGITFDVVFAHSVLSHASYEQLVTFLARARDVLRPDGFVLASLNLNEHGRGGDGWTYPYGVSFGRSVVQHVAFEHGFEMFEEPDLRRILMCARPLETHDWLVFR